MTHDECTRLLGGWAGYELAGVERERLDDGREQLNLELVPVSCGGVCARCGQVVHSIHDTSIRYVRDLPILDATTLLVVHRRRVACPDCGPSLEALSWLAPYQRVTLRLAESVTRLCAVLPIKHVAEHYALNWHQVKQIDKRMLTRRLGPVDMSNVTQIAMDEFALRKGHNYATVIAEPATRRVLYVGEGRTRESIRPFFEQLGAQGCAAIEAAVMDMWPPYTDEVRAQCPNVRIVYDLFHVVAKYSREVIDRVRVDIADQLRNDKPARKVVKGSKWLLLRNRDSLDDEHQIKLDELLEANHDLMVAYVMRDDIRTLWRLRDERKATQFFRAWYQRAMDSGIAPLMKFARRLAPFLAGIIAHCHYPLGTNFLEGMNNKIKVIKRMAYGFRDIDYFFLKIRATFPGVTR